ncbi:MAG TPA: TIGR00282 family metallophosphoesterase [Rhizobiales bacterium]|nr:TIGR00282 family metallophosphoesterase [Hyphomicrobiales bacterium]
MRILFVGDVVGRSGRTVLSEHLPGFIRDWALDLVVVNGENAAGGFGISEAILIELLDAGADVVTTGNHVFDQREALVFIERHDRLLRPINFPQGTPGKGVGLFKAKTGADVLVINAMGRVFMADLDDPFRAVERELEACGLKTGADAILIDFHAEATSEKEAMGHFVDGRASGVIGTHTHVPTADEQILRSGTAYISDAGMCGDFDSVLGMDKEEPLSRFLTKIPTGRFAPALGEATLCGVGIDVDDATGLARAIAPLRLGGRLSQTEPKFWLPEAETS